MKNRFIISLTVIAGLFGTVSASVFAEGGTTKEINTYIDAPIISDGEAEEGDTSVISTDNKTVVMTCADAVKYALEHSLTTAQKEADVYGKRYSMYQAGVSRKNTLDSPYLEVTTFDVSLLRNGYYYDAATLQYNMAERALEDNKTQIEIKVINDFYTYQNSKKSIEIAKRNLENIKEKCASAKINLDYGAISKLDYQNFEVLLMTAKNSLSQAERSAEINLITLKNTLNFPLENELITKGDFAFEVGTIMPFADAYEKFKKTSTYINLEESFELSKKRYDLAQKYYVGSQNDFKVEKATYDSAVASHSERLNSIYLGLKSMEYGLMTLKENIELSEKSLEIKKTTAEATYLKYQMGSATAVEYSDSEKSYIESENNLQALKLSYMTTKLKYDNLILQ